MAYVNELVPEEKARGFLIPGYKEVIPRIITIDKEKDYIFFKYYTDRDNPVDEYFAFVYKGKVIKMILNGEEFVDPNTEKWKITSIDIPKYMNKKHVLAELRKAVVAYGCTGLPVPGMEGKAVADF